MRNCFPSLVFGGKPNQLIHSRTYRTLLPIQSFDGVVPDSTLDAQTVTTGNELIPIVHSFTAWKICEAFDLKAKFVPLPRTKALPRTPHRDVDQTTTAPVVGSFSVWKICQALDLPATYDPQLIRTTAFRKKKKKKKAAQTDTCGRVNCCY
ncbi:hypothetical protein TNCV_4927041 [Trichonephila clavipes]|nr:hypothetical protein TNCV_4927041 [Trichonephila clavipes]